MSVYNNKSGRKYRITILELMRMSGVSVGSCLLMSFLLVMPCCVTSFDITKLLSKYPAYSTFSNYLTQTELASEINGRQSVTVLAVDNKGMGPVSGKPMDHIKKLLSIHVALHYLDVQHLHSNQTITVTTLLKPQAKAEPEGLLKIMNGTVTFVSSSVPNAVHVRAKLIKPILSESNNISLVQVDTLIMPPTLLSNPKALIPVVSPLPVLVPISTPAPMLTPLPPNIPPPVPLNSPVPIISPVPVIAPVPLINPVPVVSPVPIITPVPVNPPPPVVSPVPLIAPIPVASPVPVIAPVPLASPVPAIAPVRVIAPVPVASPVPVIAPVPVASSPLPAMGPAIPGSGESSDGSVPADQEPKSGVLKFGVNSSLAILLTLSSTIYINILTYIIHG